MKSKKIKDERTIQLNNKIQSEAFLVVIFLLGVSVFIKAYLLDTTVSEYITELITMIISLIYLSVRGFMLGYSSMDTSKRGKQLTVFSVLGLSLLISIFNSVRNYSLYGDKYTGIFDGHFLSVFVITFLSSLVFLSFILGAVALLDRFGQKRLEKKLEEDEE